MEKGRIQKARALALAFVGDAGTFALPAVASADQWFKTDVHVHTVLSSDAAEDLGILKNLATDQGYNEILVTDRALGSSFPISTATANRVPRCGSKTIPTRGPTSGSPSPASAAPSPVRSCTSSRTPAPAPGSRRTPWPTAPGTERGLTYATQPEPATTVIGSSGATTAGAYIEVDLGTLITGDGTHMLALRSSSNTAQSLASRESTAPPAARRHLRVTHIHFFKDVLVRSVRHMRYLKRSRSLLKFRKTSWLDISSRENRASMHGITANSGFLQTVEIAVYVQVRNTDFIRNYPFCNLFSREDSPSDPRKI